MDVVGVVVIKDEEVLVSAAGGDGELARLVRVYLAGDWDARGVYMLATWERLWWGCGYGCW